MPKYEVTVFNKQVREKVENGEHHEHYTDDWAEFRYVEIRALNEDQARSQVNGRFSPENGFVIDSIIMLQES